MPERQVSPEMSREQVGIKEIESKIREVDLAVLETNLRLAHAELTAPERLIQDTVYKFPKNPEGIKTDINLEAVSQKDLPEFLSALKVLGLEGSTQDMLSFIEVTGKLNNPLASIRVRKDGGKSYFTVKTDAGTTEEIKKKDELEPEILDIKAVKSFLREAGYKKAGYREKKRTTYTINYGGVKVKVDINISPDPRIKPWIEVEAPSDEYLIKTAQLLGYNKKDLYSGSDKDLYKEAGLTKDEIKEIKFSS